MSKYYAGIGSRNTPADILELMTKIAIRLDKTGWILRSGGAIGADKAFEYGSTRNEIFLPWRDPSRSSPYFEIPLKAFEIASQIHPAWQYLSEPVKKLMARNAMQILGPKLDLPSRMVICWTKDGIEKESERTKKSGGTAQAISHADRLDIPVYNLYRENRRKKFEDFTKEIK